MICRQPQDVFLAAYALGHGGTERQLTEIARALDRSRFRPHVGYFLEGPRSRELREAGVPLLHMALSSFGSPRVFGQSWRLVRYLRANHVRVMHAFDFSWACFGVPLARLAGVPLVLSSQRGSRTLIPRRYRGWIRVTDRMVDGVVVNCEAMRRHLVEDEGVPERSIHVCYNGIDLARFLAREPNAAPDRPLVVGVVSVLRPEKNFETLLDAFARVKDLRPGLRLRLVGDGSERLQLQQRAADLGMAERCEFPNATEDVTASLHGIDVFVLPSLTEAFSNSIMEAMACGCTVVASDAGGNPELVRDGETGLLFERGSAEQLASRLRLLIEDADLRSRLAAAGMRSVRERFSLAESARRMAEIYTSLLEGATPDAAPLDRAAKDSSR